jgi:hypothetical protein
MSALMKELSVRLNIQHQATMAYIHYNNGTVEVINRLVLRALRTMIIELRWKKSEWHHLVPTVQHFLNQKPQRQPNGNAPITVMSVLARNAPINLLAYSSDGRGRWCHYSSFGWTER